MNEPILPPIIPIPSKRVVDITGQRFGLYVVLGYIGLFTPKKRAYWLCRCDCGNYRSVVSDNLRAGKSNGCGCVKVANFAEWNASRPKVIRPKVVRERSIKDFTGQRFERLLVLGYEGRNRHDQTMWLCECDCGNRVVVVGCGLSTGNSNSCGCYRREKCVENGKRNKTHGMSKTKEYRAWRGMLDRCRRPNSAAYTSYGGRGIRVCEHWHEFEHFISDMGLAPSIEYSLDRIDVDGHYSCGHCPECQSNSWPANCRWATAKQQQNNLRDNCLVTHEGKTLTLGEWASTTGINYYTLWTRIYRQKWSAERALSTPTNKKSAQD